MGQLIGNIVLLPPTSTTCSCFCDWLAYLFPFCFSTFLFRSYLPCLLSALCKQCVKHERNLLSLCKERERERERVCCFCFVVTGACQNTEVKERIKLKNKRGKKRKSSSFFVSMHAASKKREFENDQELVECCLLLSL